MEVVKRIWYAFANAVGGFIEEAAFRVALAFKVLVGKVPIQAEKRPWVRSVNTPILVNVYSWTDERLIFSVLVWPPLESSLQRAPYDHAARVKQVKESFARVCADLAWSTRFETDYGLVWDHDRECWVDSGGFGYDGSKFGAGSRSPEWQMVKRGDAS